MNENDSTASTGGAQPEAGRCYALIVEGGSSRQHELAAGETVVIGRGGEAGIRLADEKASRRHAQLLRRDGAINVCDLDSHNGTLVNGKRVEGMRRLSSGDVIAIGDAVLVVYCGPASTGERRILPAAELRRQLEHEVERAAEFDRPLAVVSLLTARRPDAAALDRLAGLRRVDLAGESDDGQLVLVLPEEGADSARETASSAARALGARAGVACCPADGCDAETLLSSARAAAAEAEPDRPGRAAEATRVIELGDRTAVLADGKMLRLFELIEQLARSDLAVLITGETGTGKEHAARALHHFSRRRNRPLLALSCAALHETLVESELFGHEKGAFSGAVSAKAGLLETAGGGTVFLDEIAELSPAIQAKLLRVLEEKRVTRVGGLREHEVDIRIVAATHRRLDEEVRAGRFRQDLFFRLNGATVTLPPLRERPRGIVILAARFLDDARRRAGAETMAISSAATYLLMRYPWPGNVRELRNAMELAATTAGSSPAVLPAHLPDVLRAKSPVPAPERAPAAGPHRPLADEVRELERKRMSDALDASDGVQRRAAELIGMPLRTFAHKMKQYGLRRGG